MADVTVKRLDEFEAVFGVILSGRATFRTGGGEHALEPGVFARIGPGEKRKFVTGEEGVRILAIGGVPGRVYEPPEFTEEGAAAPPMPEQKPG